MSCCGASTPNATGVRRPPVAPPAPPTGAAPVVLVDVPGGWFLRGGDDPDGHPLDAEGPVRPEHVAAFRAGATAVTVAQFAAFVAATGHVTDAERHGWSFVVAATLPAGVDADDLPRPPGAPWWVAVEGAVWWAPEGPGSDVAHRFEHPVVHVSARDAEAFCAWSGVRLPSEPEWEKAARGGLEQQRFPWGEEFAPGGERRCNTWSGDFPQATGPVGTVRADAFAPNGFGLHQTVGNVWEWSADTWWTPRTRRSRDRVLRGGSFLCHDSHCNRYRVAARTSNAPDATLANLGFRVVADGEEEG